MSDKTGKTNRLIKEKSPYLLQHAYNPVDWYPWCEEAFKKAEEEDKPVFLSIGYSTCHWCHVMEHESFEDSSVAELMNDVFINIKVDREERPDIDNIYMSVCQMMTGAGGWPLTIIMDHNKKPFFSGTYFPKNNRYGRVGLINLIKQIDNAWKTKRDEIEQSAEQITNFLNVNNTSNKNAAAEISVLETAFNSFKSMFDNKYGGFGNSPKFPSPHNLMFLLRYWKRSGNNEALEMTEKTLKQMRMGGLFDQIGFGFHRYSTDNKWLLPHFEKMLYDQALISNALIETYQATGNDEYKRIAEEIFMYVLRDLTSPEGGFYSAEDADSEGEEGKFYVWKENEIDDLLKEDSDLFKTIFNILPGGNFTDEATRTPSGTNIPFLKKTIAELSKELNVPSGILNETINKSREILFKEREKRIHPLKDDKILTDWNGLMITSLAKAGRVFENSLYTETAEKSFGFIMNKLTGPDGKLIHRYREGEAALSAFADDYAFVVSAALELYETTFKIEFLQSAAGLSEIFINDFYDTENGGFYFTSNGSENLITRTKEIYDGAVPSANSVMFLNLLKLSRLTANQKYEDLASEISRTFSDEVSKHPTAYSMFLCALDFSFGPSYEIVIVEGKNADEREEIIPLINMNFLPNKVVVFIPIKNPEHIKNLAAYTKSYNSIENKTTVYVCSNFQCSLPTYDKEKIINMLGI
ncbi:MAG: thioredoxin domain-containing protein [Bacteroidetes bacterium]|nr:thioredoxin domain-containing protein [Bacteroidota bacterium]